MLTIILTLLHVQTFQPLSHTDLSIFVAITVPRQLLAAFSQTLYPTHHIFESFPLIPLQHFIFVLVEYHEAPGGGLFFIGTYPSQTIETVCAIDDFRHPSMQELQ